MISRLVLPVALIAGLTAYAIVARHLRHKEVIARTIAYGATRRALEQSAFAARTPAAHRRPDHWHGDAHVLPTIRGLFRRFLGFDVRTGILLLVVFGLVRVALVLQANVTGSYQLVSVVFVAMAVLPWVVLTRAGRRKIGIVRPSRWRWMLPAAVAGVTALLAVYATATALWGRHRREPVRLHRRHLHERARLALRR